jgi:hypothetical protein
MTQIEIKTFMEVVLFEMQRPGKNILSFSELWAVCAKASSNIVGADPHTGQPIKYNPDKWAKPFVRDLLGALKTLEMGEIISIHTKDGGTKINRITLTAHGAEYLKDIVFTHQQRMGLQ